MADPRHDAFWVGEHQELIDFFSEQLMEAILAGANGALDMLPSAISDMIDWDIFNTNAMAFLNSYQLNNISGIHQTTKEHVVREIQRFMSTGESLQELMARLQNFTWSDARTNSIARTEITRSFAVGNMLAWQATGYITGKRWMTARDELVCPICGPMHEQVVEVESNFALPEEALTPEVRRLIVSGQQEFFISPPAHPNCRCWLQPFVSDVAIQSEIDRILE
jgi:hypothetical protein